MCHRPPSATSAAAKARKQQLECRTRGPGPPTPPDQPCAGPCGRVAGDQAAAPWREPRSPTARAAVRSSRDGCRRPARRSGESCRAATIPEGPAFAAAARAVFAGRDERDVHRAPGASARDKGRLPECPVRPRPCRPARHRKESGRQRWPRPSRQAAAPTPKSGTSPAAMLPKDLPTPATPVREPVIAKSVTT